LTRRPAAIKMRLPTFNDMGGPMAHHLTPDELADQLQMKPQEVIEKSVEMGVPIFHGRIDRTLFETNLRSQMARQERRRAQAS
jgi:hypothetical protein